MASSSFGRDSHARTPSRVEPARAHAAQPEVWVPVPAMALPGIIGAELSRHVAQMQQVLQEVKANRTITRVQMNAMDACASAAQRVAMQSQQISRLAGGRLRQSHERLSLHQIVLDALEGQALSFRARGRDVRHHLKPVEVIVDPGLLSSLVDVAVDWASEQGQRLLVRLHIKNWPEHGMLMLQAGQHVAIAGGKEEASSPDTLNWLLLQQIALAMGVGVEREITADHSTVRLEFPRTVKQLEGLTAVEVDGGGDSTAFLSEGKPLAGHRVLLVTGDAVIKGELQVVCESMGLMLDVCPTTAQAIRFCELDKPHIIVIDERLRDVRFEELRKDLVRNDINFPVVEIAKAPNTFEMSNWMGDSVSRISRDVLRAQLPSILVMELAKVS